MAARGGLLVAMFSVLLTHATDARAIIGMAAERTPTRIGAVQAFETPESVLLYIEIDKLDRSRGGSGSRWRTAGVAAVVIADQSVSYRWVTLPAHAGDRPYFGTIHSNVSTFFGDGERVIVHQYHRGAHQFYLWADEGPSELNAEAAKQWVSRLGLSDGSSPDADWVKLKEFRERNGWKELPLKEMRGLGSPDGESIEPETLRTGSIPANIQLNYERCLVSVNFTVEGGHMGNQFEIRLSGGPEADP